MVVTLMVMVVVVVGLAAVRPTHLQQSSRHSTPSPHPLPIPHPQADKDTLGALLTAAGAAVSAAPDSVSVQVGFRVYSLGVQGLGFRCAGLRVNSLWVECVVLDLGVWWVWVRRSVTAAPDSVFVQVDIRV